MEYDVIIVGGGIAGLTGAAYLSSSGLSVLLCEKGLKTGGLVGSFECEGYTFDSGIRAIENSGIVFPMLRQLGIGIEFVKSSISVGLGDDFVVLESRESLRDYGDMLRRAFPGERDDIDSIMGEIERVMTYMDVLYDIENPLFIDYGKDPGYVFRTLLPWLMRYSVNIRKAMKLDDPINERLGRLTRNTSLIDMISQHFFRNTPSFFALSYFSLYLDYSYPMGGTGVIPERLEEFIVKNGGKVSTSTEICAVDVDRRIVTDKSGSEYKYRELIWAADMKRLYGSVAEESISDAKVRKRVTAMRSRMMKRKGGDSILSVFLCLDSPPSSFGNASTPHIFYTPSREGLSSSPLELIMTPGEDGQPLFPDDKAAVFEWVERYYSLTTYEISIPVMRDASLAPEGRTGMIASTLMDHSLVAHIKRMGWYDEFKELSENTVISVLDSSIFPGMRDKVEKSFSSTPLTIERFTGSSDGAITGWAFDGMEPLAVDRLTDIGKSVETAVPHVHQAGQWTFSPSGFPVAVLTGKLSAVEAEKGVRGKRGKRIK